MKKNPGGLLILNALAWAAAMLVTAQFMGEADHGQRNTVVPLLMAGWLVANTALSKLGRSCSSVLSCFNLSF